MEGFITIAFNLPHGRFFVFSELIKHGGLIMKVKTEIMDFIIVQIFCL